MIFYIIAIIILLYILLNFNEFRELTRRECNFSEYNIKSKYNEKDDICEYNTINNNLIVQRRIRREINDFKNEKNRIKSIMCKKKEKKKNLEKIEIDNEIIEEENNLIKKYMTNIKINLKRMKLNNNMYNCDNNLDKEQTYKILNLIDKCIFMDEITKKKNKEIINEYLFLIQL